MARPWLILCFFQKVNFKVIKVFIYQMFLSQVEATWDEIVQFCPKQAVDFYLDLLVGNYLYSKWFKVC
jgi:hypothetical protein